MEITSTTDLLNKSLGLDLTGEVEELDTTANEDLQIEQDETRTDELKQDEELQDMRAAENHATNAWFIQNISQKV